MQLFNLDLLNVTMQGMAITLVKGHEPTPYEAPSFYCWSFLWIYYVNMKGQNIIWMMGVDVGCWGYTDHYGTGGLISSLNQRLFLIRRLKNSINKEQLVKVANSIFMSKIRYGLQLLGTVRLKTQDPKNQDLTAIQLIQNKLVRILNGTKLADKIRTKVLLDNINMCSVNQIHAQIKLTEIWKTINDEDNVLKIERKQQVEGAVQTRSGGSINLVESRSSAMSSKTFINDGIKLWNRAPESIKICTTLASAKKAIKIYSKTLPIWII